MAQKKEKAGVDSKPAKAKESRIVTLKVPASAKTIVNQWQQSAPAGAVPAALGGQHISANSSSHNLSTSSSGAYSFTTGNLTQPSTTLNSAVAIDNMADKMPSQTPEDKNTTIEAKTTSFLAGSSAAAGPAIANKKGKSKAKKRKAKNSNAKAEVPTKNDLEDDGAPLKAPPNSPTLAGAPAPSQEGNVAPYSSMLGEDVWENEWTEFFNQPPGTLPAWD